MYVSLRTPPLNSGFSRSFLALHSRALVKTRSRAHSSRWYEFTRSSLIMGKFPERRSRNIIEVQTGLISVHEQNQSREQEVSRTPRPGVPAEWLLGRD